eukprot:TRINITY_DN1548_c0_g1_i2.p2 TRINITY_DN1548_c0_g1~~TRINITY_DN1548_c0_g1_i2.p2  ORF type:complete len:118 (-),score=10.05 TRINITY_DN1548_c0_g1_i2:9-362(-)
MDFLPAPLLKALEVLDIIHARIYLSILNAFGVEVTDTSIIIMQLVSSFVMAGLLVGIFFLPPLTIFMYFRKRSWAKLNETAGQKGNVASQTKEPKLSENIKKGSSDARKLKSKLKQS